MDHEEVLEQLELASTEDGGLDRLMAGDTPAAVAAAGHLAGCSSCMNEFERLRRAAPLLRDVVRTTPGPDLRERTLGHVRTYGVARLASGSGVTRDHGAPETVPVIPPADATEGRRPTRATRPPIGSWLAVAALATAAAVVISVTVTSMIVRGPLDDELAAQQRAIGGLEAVTSATLALSADPGVERVELAATGAMSAEGSLLYSPTSDRLVVVASGLEAPPATKEYRCWVVIDGERTDVGRMNFADGLAFWVGASPQVGDAQRGSMFGVSLSDVGGSGVPTDPVIAGRR
jgi:hypothetical protein